MSAASEKSIAERVSVGAIVAAVTTALVFGLWRIAATFDSGTGIKGWVWLLFEAAALLGLAPVLALLYCLLGWFVIEKGTGSRLYSVIGGGSMALLFGLSLAALGLYDVEQMGPLSSMPVTIGVMIVAGATGALQDIPAGSHWTSSRTDRRAARSRP